MAHHLFIVSRDSPDLFSYLSAAFAAEPDVTVILDRRAGARFRTREQHGAERPAAEPAAERRSQPGVGPQLATLGYAFVRLS